MGKQVNGTFEFHGIGQGLFYTGIIHTVINKEHKQFTMVYDCGTAYDEHYKSSNKILNDEINKFVGLIKEGEEKPIIDLLVISHFHWDHISSICKLVNKCTINTMVLPYMNDEDKCIILGELDEYNSNKQYGKILDFIMEVFENKCKTINNIIFVNPEIGFSNQNNVNELTGFKIENGCLNKVKDNVYNMSSGANLINLKFDWKFKFFFKTNSDSNEKTKKLINKITEVDDYEKSIEKMFKENSLINKLNEEIKEYNKSVTEDESIDIHDSCLTLLHYPINVQNNCLLCIPQVAEICSSVDSKYTFLSGDANMNLILKDLKEYLEQKEELDRRLSIVSVPHHGSEDSWKNKLGKKILDIGIPGETRYVASFGILSQYSHPSNDVLNDVKTNNSKYVPVFENNGFVYQINFVSKK